MKLTSRHTALLLITFLIYSGTGVFSKLASMQGFLSVGYVAAFAMVVTLLGVYAALWQKVLSFMPLNKAFLCKSSTIVFALILSSLLFKESITPCNIIGACFIILGLVVLSWKA